MQPRQAHGDLPHEPLHIVTIGLHWITSFQSNHPSRHERDHPPPGSFPLGRPRGLIARTEPARSSRFTAATPQRVCPSGGERSTRCLYYRLNSA